MRTTTSDIARADVRVTRIMKRSIRWSLVSGERRRQFLHIYRPKDTSGLVSHEQSQENDVWGEQSSEKEEMSAQRQVTTSLDGNFQAKGIYDKAIKFHTEPSH